MFKWEISGKIIQNAPKEVKTMPHCTMKRIIGCLAAILATSGCAKESRNAIMPPEPYGPTPSARQLAWHELEFYGFIHFTTNTFTDKEWGFGDEAPDIFNPTDFSADQIVSTAKAAGMKGLILTCKHHDGFCLWPSQYTEHSVKSSSWKNGKGDVVREIADACRKHGVEFGVYLSPWDRNHPAYGQPEYVTYYQNQLRELLTQYGPIFEVWFDGANGGDGYYGGANEKRTIDRATYYDWETTWEIVRELQPNAVIFSDAGEDVRWVGNERGWAGDPCWATYTPHARPGETEPAPGTTLYQEGTQGHRDGKFWMPAEVDVSIRPGWFYHPNEDSRVRDAENLLKMYYESVGRGASFLLNLPPDRRGRIHDNDIASLRTFRHILDETFAVNFAKDAEITASNTRGPDDARFTARHLLDGDRKTYWTCDDAVKAPELVFRLKTAVTFNVVDIREYLPLGQRVDTWALDKWVDGQWVEFAKGQAIGSRRLWRGERQTTDRVRLRLSGPVCPAISEFGVYEEPMR